METQTAMFSILYLDKTGKEIKQNTPPEEVMAVSVTINVAALVENLGLGTALLKALCRNARKSSRG